MRITQFITMALFVTAVALPVAAADPLPPGGTFADDDGNVHEGYIEAIAGEGITRGCNPPGNYYYCPSQEVTRGQMASFLVRALALPSAGRNFFSDDAGSVFERDINALAAAGITRGCGSPESRRFCPEAPVTRGQMSAFLVRAFDYVDAGRGDLFVDDDESNFEGDIDRLATAGVTRGCNPPSNDRFCPRDVVRRDQMASFLGRALKLKALRPPSPGRRIVVSEDTTITSERLVLRRGDSIEFLNGARLMIGAGASLDWQGTPTFTWSDDGRVQSLTRDVKIFGEGAITFMDGSRRSVISYVEINLQPKVEKGHYPLHWHFVGDGSRGTLVEGVVVKNSTQRAYVPHASHGITFRDTIAKNIKGEAYWWDPPPKNEKLADQSNNSEDILYDHILADGVLNHPNDDRGFRLGAIELGAGRGNAIRDSVARNIHPTHRKDCSGFNWPSIGVHQPGVWEATNLKVFNSDCHGVFVWQNTGQPHLVNGFFGTEGISQGAYGSTFEYRNVNVPDVTVHAVGWSVTGGSIGVVRDARHQREGTVTFTDVSVGELIMHHGWGSAPAPIHYVFNNTGLTCDDVDWVSWLQDSSVTTDGASCRPP